ncbi:hypothetical protein EZS27_001396 [termite gut metagenome]|uniref:Uncharacterized protein n=1 Tax=termite gut metagenome TaxID=433724 RepID=A0A5J4T176_9ZZZZ
MKYTIKVRENQTVEADSFKDYYKKIEAIRSTLHPGEILIETQKIIGIAVIMRVESPV